MKKPRIQPVPSRSSKAFTLVEAMVASALVAILVSVVFSGLMQSYLMGTEARYYNNARAVLLSFADQFQKFQVRDENGVIRPLFDPSNQGGFGLVWPDAVAPQARGLANPDDKFSVEGLEIHLYSDDDLYRNESEAGMDVEDRDEDDGKIAKVTRKIFLVEGSSTSNESFQQGARDGAKGSLIVAEFKISFHSAFRNANVEQSLWVSRTIDN